MEKTNPSAQEIFGITNGVLKNIVEEQNAETTRKIPRTMNEPEEIIFWKTIIKWGVILLVGGLVIWNIYFFGIKKWEAKIYARGQTDLIGQPLNKEQLESFNQGFQAGQILLNNSIVQQYQQSGGININIPDQNGEIKTIFLKP